MQEMRTNMKMTIITVREADHRDQVEVETRGAILMSRKQVKIMMTRQVESQLLKRSPLTKPKMLPQLSKRIYRAGRRRN